MWPIIMWVALGFGLGLIVGVVVFGLISASNDKTRADIYKIIAQHQELCSRQIRAQLGPSAEHWKGLDDALNFMVRSGYLVSRKRRALGGPDREEVFYRVHGKGVPDG